VLFFALSILMLGDCCLVVTLRLWAFLLKGVHASVAIFGAVV
jgi:hypothetical protein